MKTWQYLLVIFQTIVLGSVVGFGVYQVLEYKKQCEGHNAETPVPQPVLHKQNPTIISGNGEYILGAGDTVYFYPSQEVDGYVDAFVLADSISGSTKATVRFEHTAAGLNWFSEKKHYTMEVNGNIPKKMAITELFFAPKTFRIVATAANTPQQTRVQFRYITKDAF